MSQLDTTPPPQANPRVRRGSPPPPGPGGFFLDSVRMGWRWLTRMKTALYILLILGVLTLVGTIVPQEPNVASTVAAWRAGSEGPGVAVSQLIDVFGMYDTYGSPLFLALLLLLFLSLTACLIPRIRAFWKVSRHGRPPISRHLDSQPHLESFTSDLSPDDVHRRVRGLLGRDRFRLRAPDDDDQVGGQVAGEKGIVVREGGSLLFHLSFYVLFVAIVLGQLTGWLGQVGVVEGAAFTDTPAAYWMRDAGRWWDYDDHTGFVMELDDFRVDWVRDVAFAGQPSLFEADVTVTESDGSVRQDTISGNVPMVIDGMKVHLLDWGYAPRVVVRVDDEVVYDGYQTAQLNNQGFYRTAIKAPVAQPDVGLELGLYPYAPLNEQGTPTFTGAPWADAPVLVLAVYRGDLQLDQVQNVNTLDRTGLELVDSGYIPLGGRLEFAGGVSVEFPELRTWAGLQVSRRPMVPLLLLGAALLLAGLIPALYAYRRRLWVQAVDDGHGGSLVTVAGRAFQRPEAFEHEFDELVMQLRDEVGTSQQPSDGHRLRHDDEESATRPQPEPDADARSGAGLISRRGSSP